MFSATLVESQFFAGNQGGIDRWLGEIAWACHSSAAEVGWKKIGGGRRGRHSLLEERLVG
jgi:hypothetical protein